MLIIISVNLFLNIKIFFFFFFSNYYNIIIRNFNIINFCLILIDIYNNIKTSIIIIKYINIFIFYIIINTIIKH